MYYHRLWGKVQVTLCLVLAALLAVAPAASAANTGVPVGSSSLISELDYSDTYTGTAVGGIPGREWGIYPLPAEGLNVEAVYGHPARQWTAAQFSINNDTNPFTVYNPYPGSSGAGSATGMTQSAPSGDWSIAYGLRDDFVVQTDAVLCNDRIDIWISASDSFFDPQALAVFFRGSDTTQPYPGIGIYHNGEYNSGLTATAPMAQWHNVAVRFMLDDNMLEIFTDEISLGVVDLAALLPDANFSPARVGVGGFTSPNNALWMDNFQVGAPLPDPETVSLNYAAGPGGSLSGDTAQVIAFGGDGAAVTAVPDLGYRFVDWSDGRMDNPRTDTNVRDNINVTASFSDTFNLEYTAGPEGSLAGDAAQIVSYGGDGTAVQAVPDAGFFFVCWSDGSTDNPRTDTNVTANVEVAAIFAGSFTQCGAWGHLSGDLNQNCYVNFSDFAQLAGLWLGADLAGDLNGDLSVNTGDLAVFAGDWLGCTMPYRPGCVPAQRQLRCEYMVNPLGIDVVKPRLSWVFPSSLRGQKQTAYRVVVASTPDKLTAADYDLWDSGKVVSAQSVNVEYDGAALASKMRCYWKVGVWDKDDQLSWSQPALWSMGLLDTTDWQGQWISDPDQANSSSHNGYHSEFASSANVAKWVAVDLGTAQEIDAVQLWPARPYNWSPDTPGFLFPVRFKVETALNADFSDAQVVYDHTGSDVPNPGTDAPIYSFSAVTARHVRLTVTKLALRDGSSYGFALAEMYVLADGSNVAEGAAATALDSIEYAGWSITKLTDGRLYPDPGGYLTAMLRKEFTLSQPIKKATLYATALGLYELYLNGQRVGDHVLAPEWTLYSKRVQYQTYDVTEMVVSGGNALGALVGGGWYTGRIAGSPGLVPRLLVRLDVEFLNGQTQTIVSDGTWRSTINGPVRSCDIWDGETYDAQLEKPGWDAAGFDDSEWSAVQADALGDIAVVWQRNEPIRVVREFSPVQMTEPQPGVYVFDMGQNMVGWCRLTVEGPAGATVTLRHAEMLNADGTIYTANLRSALQTDAYTKRTGDPEVYEPHFTYHGFRYVELTGLANPPTLNSLVGRAFHSASPDAGYFSCSNAMLNQLMHNIIWTQRGNMHSVPTDCPQRDERYGWMGDIQAFSQTAAFNMDMAGFFSKWVRDIRDSQDAAGRYPDVAPGSPVGTPAWGDAGTVVPWRMYQNYADTRMLAEHFDSARRWVDYVRSQNPNLLWQNARGGDYNDWLNADTLILSGWPASGGSVPNEVLATAFFAHSTEIVAKMAAALGLTTEAAYYSQMFEDIKTAFNTAYVSGDGSILGNTQAGYALALRFDLLSEALRPLAAAKMIAAFGPYDGHLSTGIQTSHQLMLELTRNGYNDEAYQLLNLNTCPSWGYMIAMGATTIWERWDGYVAGRGFQNAGMNSFNHWAFGAVGEWMWRHIAGINPDDAHPGYKHFVIHPRPGGGLTWARGEYNSVHGLIVSDWRIDADTDDLTLNIIVPANTTATVHVPATALSSVSESGVPADQAEGVTCLGMEDGCAVFTVESGSYHFVSDL